MIRKIRRKALLVGALALVALVQPVVADPTSAGAASARLAEAPTQEPRAAAAAAPARFVPLAPTQVAQVSLAANGTAPVQVTGAGGVPTAGVTAVAVSVAVDLVQANTLVRVYPDGGAPGNYTTVWAAAGTANVATEVVPLSAAGKLRISSVGTARVTLRLRGYYSSQVSTAPGGVFAPVPPTRVGAASLPAGGTSSFQVTGVGGVPAAGVSAVLVSVTVDLVQANTSVVVHPDGPRPSDLSAWVPRQQARVTSEMVRLS